MSVRSRSPSPARSLVSVSPHPWHSTPPTPLLRAYAEPPSPSFPSLAGSIPSASSRPHYVVSTPSDDVLSPSTMSPTLFTLPRVPHPRFHMPDGNVEFSVEGVLFKVHRYVLLRDSEFFRAAIPEVSDLRGDAVCLDHVKAIDFERLLEVIYPIDFCKYSATTLEEWTSVLHLASEWGFTSIRALAVRELGALATPVDKLVLGHRYSVYDWLKDAYIAVCQRPAALTLEEGLRLGMEDVIKIAQIRQTLGTGVSRSTETATILVTRNFVVGPPPAVEEQGTPIPLTSNDGRNLPASATSPLDDLGGLLPEPMSSHDQGPDDLDFPAKQNDLDDLDRLLKPNDMVDLDDLWSGCGPEPAISDNMDDLDALLCAPADALLCAPAEQRTLTSGKKNKKKKQ